MRIDVKNVKKYYGEKLVLNIERLSLETDKILGIIGFNGAGKSTLISIIGGLDTEYTGEVLFDDKNYTEELINDITVVVQKPVLLKKTVYKNLEYPLKIRKIPKEIRHMKIMKILRELDIEKLKHSKAHRLSGGEEKKVSLARAMIIEPKVLLLDEPTANVDDDSVKLIEDKIRSFKNDNKGIILLITHSLKQVNRVCDEIIYMENGTIRSLDEIF